MFSMKKIFLYFLYNSAIIIVIVLIQISFIPSLPAYLKNFNLIFSFISFTTIIINYHRGLLWALLSGLLLDIYSLQPFGLISFSYLSAVIIMNFLFNHLFTNRSLYTLILLSLLGTILHNILILIINIIIKFINPLLYTSQFSLVYLQNLFLQSVYNVIGVILIFITFNYISSKTKSYFLVSE